MEKLLVLTFRGTNCSNLILKTSKVGIRILFNGVNIRPLKQKTKKVSMSFSYSV